MPWDDDSWRDGYDEWKLRSPYDDYEDPCDHEDYDIDILTGEWWCPNCNERRTATEAEIVMMYRHMAEYAEYEERENRRQWWRDLFWPIFWVRHKISAGCFRFKRGPAATDDEIPF